MSSDRRFERTQRGERRSSQLSLGWQRERVGKGRRVEEVVEQTNDVAGREIEVVEVALRTSTYTGNLLTYDERVSGISLLAFALVFPRPTADEL